jgi:uncharacterized OB-fold protein
MSWEGGDTVKHVKPLPKINADTKAFWEGCREHELRFQACGHCGHLRWPPAILCPRCLSRDTRLTSASGRGTVYSYAVYHVAFNPAFQADVPYVVALVALEEGPHILSNVVGCDPAEVSCDMAVEVDWDDVSETLTIPRFRPAGK